MKENLDHLPQHKQDEIAEIVEIIKEIARPEKIVLFGSHASNKWVEDEYVEKGATYSYISDYDFLVVIKKGGQEKEHEIVSKIENRTEKFKNDVSPIVHDIVYVNRGLEDGQYFFSDLIKEGILLYDTGNYEFSKPVPLTPEKERERAEGHFKMWVESGTRFLMLTKESFEKCVSKGLILNEVIFMLHQTTEKFYGGLLLVFTGYKPKTHKLTVYRKYSKHISEDLNHVFKFPKDDPEEFRLFDILNRSYLDSRYQDGYYINKEDLAVLIKKVELLEDIVVKLTKGRIASLRE